MKFYYFLSCSCLFLILALTACDSGSTPEQAKLNATNQAVLASSTTIPVPTAVNLSPTVSKVPTALPTLPPPKTDPNGTIIVQLDPSKFGPNISPYIYGLAGTDDQDPNYVANLQPTLMRWGGNNATRFNWVLGNAWNAGRDYEFRNGDYGLANQDVATEAIQSTLKSKMAMLLTIPTIGWVARNTDTNTRSLKVPAQGGPPVAPGSEAIAGYDPTANRALTSVQSKARKNAPFVDKPDPNSPIIYQDEWVASLVKRFGNAANGGVKFYAMDNEPDLWSQEHTDVHPTRVGYDELLSRFVDYASAVKAVDPTALVIGPESWGWLGYNYSELDRGSDNFKTVADRVAHGNLPLLIWFLQQLHQYETQKGKRILDVLDVHFYPQETGVFAGNTDPQTNALRLRATRALWDPNYTDESWINTQIKLIPRLQSWINSYYPGTKLGISEWNFGADTTLNGALAISQALGIFGREGVYLAAYWRYPPQNSPGLEAFKMYTNFDGKGSSFGDKSIPVKVSDDQKISCFAALDSTTGKLRLILVNQQPDKSQAVKIQLPQSLAPQSVPVYQLSAQTGNKLTAQTPLNLNSGATIELSLPAYSATLLDLQPPATH